MSNDICTIRLIVGLGNVGSEYDHTRHNIGYDLMVKLCDKFNITLSPEAKFSGLTGRGKIAGNEVRFIFPTTYMNESGRAVGALCTFFKIKPEEVLVLHDDLDLEPGFMKLKFAGGLAGHNGLRSITKCLANSQNYYRLRLGIGKPPSKDVVSWVLGRPNSADQKKIDDAYETAIVGIERMFTQGVSKATALINGFKPN